MDYAKEILHAHQTLQAQMKSNAFDSNHQRRSANYKPNIWNYDFLQSLNSIYHEEKYKRMAEELVEDVKHMFAEAVENLAKLELIDSIRKLGLKSFFEEEIKKALDTIASEITKLKVPNAEDDLYATALCFRLLRLHGYQVSQDMFSSFIKETGEFSTSKTTANLKGVLELFEASHLALENENNLEEAKYMCTHHLKNMDLKSDNNIVKQVAHSLELPLHWRVQWFSVKWHINNYEKQKNVNVKLIELAKLNFNTTQASHQKDLQEISRWWRNLGLIEKLDFARDRLVESFMCAVGLVCEPHFKSFRKWLTKVIIMILIIDDVYDIYASLEELEHFTDAVDRWDFQETEQLPECMKICFAALYDMTNDIAFEIQKEKGWIHVLPHLKKVWGDFCKALFVEAKWFNTGYTPSLQEYISNAWITSSGPLILIHAFFAVTHEVPEEVMVEFLKKNKHLIYNSSLVIRLCNDLGTSVAEKERGDVASSILCYMRDANVSEGIAQKHVKGVILKSLKKMNEHYCTTQSPLLQLFGNIAINAARVAHSLYQYEDGFGVQDRKTRDRILSLLVEPIVLD